MNQASLLLSCLMGFILFISRQATALRCVRCQVYNVTVGEDIAGVGIALKKTFESQNDHDCLLGDQELLEALGGGENATEQIPAEMCTGENSRCYKAWGDVSYTYYYTDEYYTNVQMSFYRRGCTDLDPLIFDPDYVVEADPYNPADKCKWNDTHYLHAALNNDFVVDTYSDAKFKDSEMCFCTKNMCNGAEMLGMTSSVVFICVGLLTFLL